MSCVGNCLIASVMLCGVIASMVTSRVSPKHAEFKKLLNKKEEKAYEKIIKERLMIYLIGLCVGVVIAFFVVMMSNINSKRNKACMFVAVALIVNAVVYMAIPKKDWMLNHIGNNQEKVNAWLAIYKEMKMKKLVGMGVGVVAYYLLGDGLLNR